MNAADKDLLDEFSDALWLRDGLSKNTLDSYRSDLTLFAHWLHDRAGSLMRAVSPCFETRSCSMLCLRVQWPTSDRFPIVSSACLVGR